MDKRLVIVLLIAGAAGFWLGASNECWRIWGAMMCGATVVGLISGWIIYPRNTMYPFYHWEIQIELIGAHRSTTIFPVTIKPLKDAEIASTP